MQIKSFIQWEFLSQILKRCGYILVITLLAGQIQMFAADNHVIVNFEQQQITITGTVTDDQGDPLPGVNVVVKGTTIGQVTNFDGKFSINVPSEEAVLLFTFVGFMPQEVVVGSNRSLSITMAEDAGQIEEVVVVGYGTQRKATITGSISSVSSQELTVTKNENVINMLTGKMPGLRISQRSSQPGAYDAIIDVRGYGEPLFVIDGVARDKDFFARMDPESIESISLLKDASAAIYGIRAANGVMLITTKTGQAQEGKVDITYKGTLSFQQMIFIPRGYTTLEWMTLSNESEWRDMGNNFWERRNPKFSKEQLEEAVNGKSYDWQREIFRKVTPQTQHNLSINGGSEKLRYFVSLGYLKQDGCYASGSMWADRWNVTSNVDAQITQRLSARVSMGATIGRTHNPNGGLWDVYKEAFLITPNVPFYVNDNPDFLNGRDYYDATFTNLLGKMDEKYVGHTEKHERRLNGNLSLKYEIPGVKGLSARAFYDYSANVPDEYGFKQAYYVYQKGPAGEAPQVASTQNGPTTVYRRADVSVNTNMQLGLNYQNRFNLHSVGGTFVYEETYGEWDNFTAQRYLLLNSRYLSAGEAEGQTGSGGTPGDRSQRAFIGRANYDFAGKYMAEFLFRYEASSRWPKDSRWGFFPSISVGWRLSEEGFIKNNIDFISNLKIRASYGQVGSEDVGNFNYPQTFVGYENWNNGGWIYKEGSPTSGIRPTAIPNLDLTWLKVIMKNIAIDFGFFNEKLVGSFELFSRDREGLLATSSAIVPGTVGANLPQENLNHDRNFGWEIELSHRNRIGDVGYFISGQLSHTRRKWVSRLEEPASHSYDNWRNRYSGRYHNDDFWWTREMGGMFSSLDEIRNYSVVPQPQGAIPGDWWQVDWNGDGVVNDEDQRPLATRGLPYFTYGIALGANYKGFDLTAQFQGAWRVYMQVNEVFTEALPFGGKNSLNWFVDRWRPENINDDFFSPKTKWISGYYPLTGGDARRTQSNGIWNSSYCRLKTLEIGYTLPKDLLSKAKIKDLRVYFSGYNLLTFSALDQAIDPERPSSTARAGTGDNNQNYVQMYGYPNNKIYSIGAQIKF